MTTRPNIHRAFTNLPEVSEVAIGSSPGGVHIALCWCGRRDPDPVVRDVIRRSIAVGVQWRVDVDWWRWSWTRGLLRPRRVTATSSDPGPKIPAGTLIAQPGGREYMIIGRATFKRSWWRRALVAIAIRWKRGES